MEGSSVILTTLLYGSEWETGSSSASVVEKYPSLTWRDRVRNEEAIGQACTLEKVLWERRMRWLGHVVRMEEVCIPKQALYWEVEDIKWRPGRSRTNWRGVVKNDLQWMWLTWVEIDVLVQDRQELTCGRMHWGWEIKVRVSLVK